VTEKKKSFQYGNVREPRPVRAINAKRKTAGGRAVHLKIVHVRPDEEFFDGRLEIAIGNVFLGEQAPLSRSGCTATFTTQCGAGVHPPAKKKHPEGAHLLRKKQDGHLLQVCKRFTAWLAFLLLRFF
jgi:hypothetical protein